MKPSRANSTLGLAGLLLVAGTACETGGGTGCPYARGGANDLEPRASDPMVARVELLTQVTSQVPQVPLNTTYNVVFTVSNMGTAHATNLEPVALLEWPANVKGSRESDAVRYKGGVFPGVGGTCEVNMILERRRSCRIVLESDADQPGFLYRGASLRFFNGMEMKTAQVIFVFEGK